MARVLGATRPLPLILAALTAVVAGCDAGGDKRKTTGRESDTTASPPAGTGRPASPFDLRVLQQVRPLASGKAASKPSTRARVKAGENVVLLTSIQGPRNRKGSKIRIRVPIQESERLKVQSQVVGGTGDWSTAQLRASRPVVLTGLRYACTVEGPTICPVRVKSSETHHVLTVRADGPVSVGLLASVKARGEVPPRPRGAPAAADPSAYKLTQQVLDPDSRKFAENMKVKSGDLPTFLTRIAGPRNTKGLSVRLTIPTEAAEKLVVQSQVVGGKSRSTATVTSDGPIRLTGIRFSCPVGAPSFCPVKINKRKGRYELLAPADGPPGGIAFSATAKR